MTYQNKGSDNFIYFAVAAVNLMTFTAGGCFSWTSPIIPKLSDADPTINPLKRPITTFEQSCVAALMNLGAVIGPLAGGVCSQRFGKKNTLLLLGIPMVISHVLCAFAINIHFFFVARFLIGIGVGTVFGVVPGYVGDIAEDKNRGILGCLLGVSSCSGTMMMYLIGPFLSVRIFSLINIIPMILFYALFGCCIPQSPYDLVNRGNRKAAEESLIRLRNKTSGEVEKELAYIIDAIEESESSSNNGFLSFFRNKALTKALLICNGLMVFQQLSGICAVIAYMQSIFEAAGTSIPAEYSSMLVGLIQVVANIACAQLVDRAGRKILLIISCIFSVISLVSLGAYFYLKETGENVDEISWLPITSLIVFVTAFNFGVSIIPWVLLAELFPANIKGLASTITSFFSFLLSFIVTMSFPYLSAGIGLAGSFWIFAAVLVVGLAFIVMLLPETKGKSSQEIQNILEGIQK